MVLCLYLSCMARGLYLWFELFSDQFAHPRSNYKDLKGFDRRWGGNLFDWTDAYILRAQLSFLKTRVQMANLLIGAQIVFINTTDASTISTYNCFLCGQGGVTLTRYYTYRSEYMCICIWCECDRADTSKNFKTWKWCYIWLRKIEKCIIHQMLDNCCDWWKLHFKNVFFLCIYTVYILL